MSKDLLFVVHAYPPHSVGGSEYNVQRLAEEAVRQGHNAVVLTNWVGKHNDVQIENNPSILTDEAWDLIFVHGSCPIQDIALNLSPEITKHSPLYYALIQPSDHPMVQHGMKYATYIGCGTSFDYAHAAKYGHQDKSVEFRYGIPLVTTTEGMFRERYSITTKEMFLSVGGYWPHKMMHELVDAFKQANRPDCTLVLMGYDTRFGSPPPQSENVMCIVGSTQEDVYAAMDDADLYIMNSENEGFGLVLLEAMLNKTPWIARDIAGAHDMQKYGQVYNSFEDLVYLLKTFDVDPEKVQSGFEYVVTQRSIENALESVLGML